MMQWIKPAALLLAVLPVLSAQPGRFSIPACDSADRELASRAFFLACYSSSLKVPVWTAYELLPSQLGGSSPRPSRFRHDAGLVGPSASDADYRFSGFSRGHMVPAEDLAFSDASIQATFLLSNVAPQRQALNAGRWRQLEKSVRTIAAHSDAVYVFTGPVFDAPETNFIGTSRVAVPTHFYKVILAVEGDRKIMYAAILPNAEQVEEGLNQYATTVDEVERRSGLDFFSALADSEEGLLESVRQMFPVHGAPLPLN